MKLLILNSVILAAGTLLNDGENIRSYSPAGDEDAVYPQSVIAGWQIVDVDVPSDFTKSTYTCDGTSVTKKIPVVTPPSPGEVEAAVQKQLDTYSQSWGYDDIGSAATYVGSAVPKFNNEGTVLRNWRDQTWVTVESVDAQIAAGTLPYPVTIAAALALLPSPPARPV